MVRTLTNDCEVYNMQYICNIISILMLWLYYHSCCCCKITNKKELVEGIVPFLNTVPFYCWNSTETSVIISEGQTSVTLDVSVTRSGPVDPEFQYMQCATFSLLNKSVDSKLIMSVGYAHNIYETSY